MKNGKSRIVAPVQRAKGGKAEPDLVSGNPKVIGEAEEDETGDVDTVAKAHSRKHGGKAKHHKRKEGGKVLGFMTGGNVRPRLDRPGRKKGGAIGRALGGSTGNPLSSAHSTTSQDAGSSNPKDTYGGTPK